jgi:LPS-assembly protein
LVANHPYLAAQQVTSVAPLPETVQEGLPDAPGTVGYPDAQPIAAKDQGTRAVIQAVTQTEAGGHYVLDGDVEINYEDRTVKADHAEYDEDTGETTLTGHVLVTADKNDERIHASHATMNLKTQTGRFYDVTGSVGMKPAPTKPGRAPGTQRMLYSNSNPFLFTGRLVVKTGPKEYEVYDGTVTSCLLPHPDWLLSGAKFLVDEEKARAANSIFHLMSIPVLWLPYVTHPVDKEARQSGLMIPVPDHSNTKGFVLGEQAYWAINRSMDVIGGVKYYSIRGWEENATFRYRGRNLDMARAHFSALQDRGYTPVGGAYINQSGVDMTFSGRRDFLSSAEDGSTQDGGSGTGGAQSDFPQTRAAATVEYLSSFPYREAFSDNFNQAVSTDVVSTVYGTHEWNGMAASLEGDRYQGEKQVATAVLPEEQVHIFHVPSLEFSAADHGLGSTGLEWSMDSSAAALKRIQPNFATSGMIERLDLHPELAYPLGLGAWRLRPSVAVRETFYSRSRLPPMPGLALPVESTSTLNRTDAEVELDLRAPVVERTFDSGFLKKVLKHDVKHTIEPEVTYRYVSGIGNFQHVLRFDQVDVASDTNELQYGVTQRLFLKQTGKKPCHVAGEGADANEVLGPTDAGDAEDVGDASNAADSREAATPVCGNREWISWRLTQKYFFDPTFGGAVSDGRRNILDTTLAFSGIAFLTEPRNISPLLSRLRVRTSEKMDFEWDFDYDTGAKKFTADNVYVDVHQGNMFAGVSYARLNAPGRSFVEGVASNVANFSQMRVLFGFRKPTDAGLSMTGTAGIDLDLASVQYGSAQTSYNWNCCGVSVEYRRYELGTAPPENAYRFQFTLVNIGAAGNIRHAQPVF